MVSRLTEVASVSFLGHWGAGVLGVSFYGAYIAKRFCPEAGSGAQTGVSTPVPYTRSCPDKARPFGLMVQTPWFSTGGAEVASNRATTLSAHL